MNAKYPLEELLKIKINRFEQAVKIFEEKTQKLLKAREKLLEVEEERNKVLDHKTAKINQLRQALDEGTTTDKIQQMKRYLEVVDEKLKEKQRKVNAQQKLVEAAKKELERAKKILFEKKKDVEKLKIHQTAWKKEILLLEKRIESLEHDELGSTRFILRKYEKEKKKRS